MQIVRFLLSLVLLVAAAAVHAQATVVPDGRWRAALGLGASLASGNTESTNLTLSADAVRATATDKATLYGAALYARSEGVTSGEQLRGGGRYDSDLTPAVFGFGGLDAERNRFANLKLRLQGSTGLGYHLAKNAEITWDVFGGLAYSADHYYDPTEVNGALRTSYSYPSLMLGEELTIKLSETATASQKLVVLPNLQDRGEYRANWAAKLAVAITRSMNLTAGFTVDYNSTPGPGRRSTDTLLTTGLSVKFD